jgi:hypothetical protein
MTVLERIEEKPRPGRLGRHVEHDPASRAFAVEPVGAPLVKVLHSRRVAAFDQGNLGSCTGNAATGILDTAPFRDTSKPPYYAVGVYAAATVIDGFPGTYPPDDTGSSGLAVAKVLLSRGLIKSYQHAFSITAALEALQVNAVITGVNWYSGFDNPDPVTGIVKLSGYIRGGHEFEALGYDPATDLVTAINSWGPGWGLKGRFRFTSKDWAQLLSEQGDVTAPVPL